MAEKTTVNEQYARILIDETKEISNTFRNILKAIDKAAAEGGESVTIKLKVLVESAEFLQEALEKNKEAIKTVSDVMWIEDPIIR